MENDSPNHFIALIRAVDADAGTVKSATSSLDDPYMREISGYQFGGGRHILPHVSSPTKAGGYVTCELGSHIENYTLTLNHQTDAPVGGSEYVLTTRTLLDREREQRQFVVIRCFDDGSPPKTSTATVEVIYFCLLNATSIRAQEPLQFALSHLQVEILDQNDCAPEINVHTRLPSSHRAHQSNIASPIPRSHLADIIHKSSPDWPASQRSPFIEHPLVNAYETGIPVVPVSTCALISYLFIQITMESCFR